jgi:hypothetical protein
VKAKSFRLQCLDKKLSTLWFWVFVYENVEDLREAATNYEKGRGTNKVYEDCLGICHPYERVIIEKGKSEVRHDNAGIIRLSRGYLSTEIVSHEALHAAFWIYRLDFGNKENANFGKNCSQKEENLCHIYGQLFTNMTGKLYKHGFWKGN